MFQLLDIRPFVPFDVDMENGRRIHISHPENVTIFPRGITALHVAGQAEGGAG